MSVTTDSNLFLIEFKLRWAKMSLFKLLQTLDLYSVDL